MNIKEIVVPRLKARSTALVLGAAFALAAPALGLANHSTAVTIYEAENARIVDNSGVFESTNAGFSGSGYFNYNNASNTGIEFTINIPTPGTYFVGIRYANGTTSERGLELIIDGRTNPPENRRLPAQSTRPLDSNGVPVQDNPPVWTTWYTDGLQVQFDQAGAHTVTLMARGASGGPNLDRLEVASHQPPPGLPPVADWSRSVVDSTMARFPISSGGVGGWEYSRALYLYGQYLTWRRVDGGNVSHSYMRYLKDWLDSKLLADGTPANGTSPRSISNLDSMLPANLCLIMAKHFPGQSAKYNRCATYVRDALINYPRVDGGFQHSKSANREGQLWLDGVFMGMPFFIRYGQQIGERDTANFEAANQLVIYANKTRRDGGLLRHAFWKRGVGADPGWADASGQSPEYWCRALGWFGMTHIEILEFLPLNHSLRPQVLATLQALVSGLAAQQDPETGLWYQVVDKGSNLGNWHETSCSSMHAYTILRAVEKGYVDASFRANAELGRAGVMKKVTLAAQHDGTAAVPRTVIRNISRGTNVDNLTYYFQRVRPENDMHGLGAFLIMNEAFAGNSGWGGTPPPDPDPYVEVSIPGSAVTASANDGNVPANTVDNNLATRWSASGDGQWILFDLEQPKTVGFVKIAFYKGNERRTRFDLQLSDDGVNFRTVGSNLQSSGTSLAEETFEIADETARYVRYFGHGNSANAWNSLTEVSIFEKVQQ